MILVEGGVLYAILLGIYIAMTKNWLPHHANSHKRTNDTNKLQWDQMLCCVVQDGSIDYAEFVAMMRKKEKGVDRRMVGLHHEEDVDLHKDTTTENATGGVEADGKRG